MKLQFAILAGAAIAAGFSLSAKAQPEPSHENFNKAQKVSFYDQIEIKNFQDESLGRITDLGLDLANGRIVEVLVVSDSSLNVGEKIVAVPPSALYRDPDNDIYRLIATTEVFKSAPAIDLSNWVDSGRSERVAATFTKGVVTGITMVAGMPSLAA